MASLFFEKLHQRYRVRFEYQGVCYNRSLGTSTGSNAEADAKAVLARVEKTLGLVADGFIEMPTNTTDPARFIISGGKDTGRQKTTAVKTLQGLFDAAIANTPNGAKEKKTLETDGLHRKHLLRILTGRTPLRSLTPTSLQTYIATRSSETYRGITVSAQTIRKEVGRLRADWNKAQKLGLIEGLGAPPTKGLEYPKDAPKPPFRSWEQIEAVLKRGGLTDGDRAELWASLFLRIPEIEEMLSSVEGATAYPFIHPMFAFVAYTGARRSEMIRSRIEDIDFATNLIRLREKKRDRSKVITFRHVDMAVPLARILRAWFDSGHPGGPYTICLPPQTRMKNRKDWVPLTKDEARYHFECALQGSKWEVIPGFHCFRHSFASNAASRGVPPAQIDAWMGHQTAEMRDRYRHLFPEQGRKAIDSLFGDQ